jgi:hypothetical protein
MVKHQQKLEKKQMLLGRLMDIGTELFVMAAVCAYAKYLKEKEPQNDIAGELAHSYCKRSMGLVEQHFAKIKSNDDPGTNALAEKILGDQALFLEKGIVDS